MTGLGDTIARLSALRAKARLDVSHIPGRLQDLRLTGSNPGALKARTFIPTSICTKPPLVVVLHGCLQNAAAYDHGSGWSTVADEHKFALLFPEQQRSNNPNLCFNWFQADDTQRGRGEALSINQMIEQMISEYGCDRRRVFVTGLSAGGAMANVMLATYPELFAAGSIIAGLPYGCAGSVQEAFERMRGNGLPAERELANKIRRATSHQGPWPAISVWHGAADMTVAPATGQAALDQWRAVHKLPAEPTGRSRAGGHERRVWSDSSGREMLEEHIIAGMGHGTPLDTGPDGCGAAGPFMLNVGISSTRIMTRIWGLAPQATHHEKTESRADRNELPVPTTSLLKYKTAPRKRAKLDQAGSADGVRKVIEDALRAAGLMN